MLQEYFSCGNSVEELESMLKSTGFKRVKDWKRPTYEIGGVVFINVQKITGEGHVAFGSGHQYCFVMELNVGLEWLPEDHPLFSLFKQLKEPQAHGIMGLKPKYTIDQYLK